MRQESMSINEIISKVLKIGSIVGITFMVAGLLLYKGTYKANTAAISLSHAINGVLKLDSYSLITVGLFILIMTPVIRVLGAALAFLLVEKDRKYFYISGGVFIILLISIFLVRG